MNLPSEPLYPSVGWSVGPIWAFVYLQTCFTWQSVQSWSRTHLPDAPSQTCLALLLFHNEPSKTLNIDENIREVPQDVLRDELQDVLEDVLQEVLLDVLQDVLQQRYRCKHERAQ